MRRLALLPLLGALVLGLAPPVGAAKRQAARTVATRYAITLIGLPVGRADFNTTIDGDSYRVAGTLSSGGLANLVSRTSGTSEVTGRIKGNRLFAERYRLDYMSDKKSWRSDVRYRSGTVRSVSVAPAVRKPERSDYVPVTKKQLASVVDPLSGLMIKPGKDPAAVCRRTVPFFDGWSRINLVMSAGGTRPFRADGFQGEATMCNVRIEAVGGYRKSSASLQWLENQTVQIWFAQVPGSDIHAPVYVRIPTKVGALSLTATVFGKD